MSIAKRYRGAALGSLHEVMQDLHAVGAIGKAVMRDFDVGCLKRSGGSGRLKMSGNKDDLARWRPHQSDEDAIARSIRDALGDIADDVEDIKDELKALAAEHELPIDDKSHPRFIAGYEAGLADGRREGKGDG